MAVLIYWIFQMSNFQFHSLLLKFTLINPVFTSWENFFPDFPLIVH